MIRGIMHVCPECRHVVVYTPTDAGVMPCPVMLCAEDGYQMKQFVVDDMFVTELLCGRIPNAGTKAAGTEGT